MLSSLAERCQLWLSLDRDEKSLNTIQALLADPIANEGELGDRMLADLSFGTAGLRAEMGPGFSRINPVTVQLATQGVAEYLLQRRNSPASREILVVVGHDHRHNSLNFAQITRQTLRLKGIKVQAFKKAVPTPFVAFAVRQLKADFGIMITASHNPAKDNGYKVYGQNGCQIMSPIDRDISFQIAAQNYRLWTLNEGESAEDGLNAPDALVQSNYNRGLARLFARLPAANPKPPPILYTPFHGVGWEYVASAVEACGLPELMPFPLQMSPDPDFPTVQFPNPEEGQHVFTKAFKYAEQHGIELIFANDPDADRFIFAAFNAIQRDWRVFSGDEIGAIFATYLWEHRQLLYPGAENFAMLSSCVSSQFLRRMSVKEGFMHRETLTGFKNLGNEAQKIEAKVPNCQVLLAYEEAIGFMVGGTDVWDKDGISALILAYKIFQDLKESFAQHLDQRIYSKYARHAQFNSYYYCQQPTRIPAILERLHKTIPTLAPVSCHHVDLSTKGLIKIYFDESERQRLIIRASGTEPKVKFYSETSADTGDSGLLAQLRSQVLSLLQILLDPKPNGLTLKET